MPSPPLEFRISQRKVIVTSAKRLNIHQAVYRLEIQTLSVVDYIPIPFRRSLCEVVLDFCPYVKTRFPKWFLPPTVILKKRKTDWHNEFEVEKSMYCRLKPLQGSSIPYFYGEGEYDGAPALVLSEVIGQTLIDLLTTSVESDSDSDEQLKIKLLEVYGALAVYGVVHGDCTPLNVIDTGDQAMLVDLELAWLEEPDVVASLNKGDALGLALDFRMNREKKNQNRAPW